MTSEKCQQISFSWRNHHGGLLEILCDGSNEGAGVWVWCVCGSTECLSLCFGIISTQK